jgi:hypothetical protein
MKSILAEVNVQKVPQKPFQIRSKRKGIQGLTQLAKKGC